MDLRNDKEKLQQLANSMNEQSATPILMVTDDLLYVISGMLDGARINEMSYGLIGPEQLAVRLWIAPETFELHRAVIVDRSNLEGDEPRTWQVDFGEFGRVVDVAPPLAAE